MEYFQSCDKCGAYVCEDCGHKVDEDDDEDDDGFCGYRRFSFICDTCRDSWRFRQCGTCYISFTNVNMWNESYACTLDDHKHCFITTSAETTLNRLCLQCTTGVTEFISLLIPVRNVNCIIVDFLGMATSGHVEKHRLRAIADSALDKRKLEQVTGPRVRRRLNSNECICGNTAALGCSKTPRQCGRCCSACVIHRPLTCVQIKCL